MDKTTVQSNKRWFDSFYSKLALGLLLSFSLIALLLTALVEQLTTNYQSEVEQKLHLELAEHIVQDDKLLKNGKVDRDALEHTFHSMMILGPSFELYVVTPQGQVTTYSADDDKIKRMQVDLKPIKEFLSSKRNLPIVGDDPRSEYRQKIFSVAEIIDDGELVAYLYIIIGGEIYDGVVDLLQNSHIIKLSFWGFIATLFFSLVVVLLLFAMLTRPIRRLATDMKLFRADGFEKGNMPDSEWDENSTDEIHRLGATFNEMASTLKEQYEKVRTTDELRRELISYVSHDLRTPLAALQGYLETWQLKKDKISESESAELIQIAANNAQHISSLVEQLFELAHLDSENASLILEPVSIAELAQDVIQKLALEANKKSLTLDVVPKDPALLVLANTEKMERVFTNLLENAIRHCELGGVVTIKMTVVASKLKISIKDDGCGIPPADLSHVFEAHYRAVNSAQGTRTNSGLGLAITRRIIELHQSKISVKSELGVGSTFDFELSLV
ncbi:MAG: signal transduction histidine kinase [Pseudohongiellaceae bacterium]|jgi:signal transduction histidine kinase